MKLNKVYLFFSDFYLRSENSNFRFENRLTGEVIEMINIETVSENRLTFDILTSEGILLENFILDAETLSAEVENARLECWQCVIIPAIKLVEAILDTLGDNFDSNCAKAIESCGESGPKSVEITEGWFSSSCKVEC
ncbi:hypothetical protein MM236_05040 [Belliella sp. DSM 107340]|uniref:Uncharacterized protein n=1 Tax=Belliella calami TaxID=2923436 RepID=A0ABS9UL43_9BACT|nr:hypothetical protein [Belliella calami]MCH7397340.1 hypothetical protein [Belliella calami]